MRWPLDDVLSDFISDVFKFILTDLNVVRAICSLCEDDVLLADHLNLTTDTVDEVAHVLQVPCDFAESDRASGLFQHD